MKFEKVISFEVIMATDPLNSFIASQTLLLQQMQKRHSEEAQANANCLKSIGETLASLKKQITDQGKAITNSHNGHEASMAEIGRNATTLTQNIPWPQPLEVEVGDIYDNFQLFNQNWLTYCSATGIDTWGEDMEARKINILLSIIGDKAKKKYANFHIKNEDMTTTDNILKIIRDNLVSERNLLFDRYTFHNCNQLEEESFDTYYCRLKKLFELCRYDQQVTAKDMLRDKLAFGIKDPNLKKKFLRQDPDTLTLEKLIHFCRANELSETRFKDMSIEEKAINKISKKTNIEKNCRFCDTPHEFKKNLCPAWGKICAFCKGKNHFARVCLKKEDKKRSFSPRDRKSRIKNIKEIKGEHEDSDDGNYNENNEEDLQIFKLKDNGHNSRKGRTELYLKMGQVWKNIPCDLDTCSDANVIGFNEYCKLSEESSPKLRKSKGQLKSFGGGNIEVIGEVDVECRRKSKNINLTFLVVNVNHGPLLSEKACLSLGLVKYCFQLSSICSDEDLEERKKKTLQILEKNQDIFEGYGNIPGEISLEIKPNSKPVMQTARRIPISLRNDLKKELERLEKENIIQKENHNTEWVSNILLIKRKSNSIRICLDPSDLNAQLMRPHFQFTTLDEILPELGQARIFSTLDTKKGFWHLKLTENSSKLTTFWTPFGRFRWLRLPFGISSAPEIFAHKMQEITQDLKGVEVLIDDILIYGCGENMKQALEDHNENLQKLLIRLKEHNCKLNREKVKLCQTSVKFFGHVLTSEGLRPDQDKTSAISKMTTPRSREELLRFLGMVTYLSRYLKKLSSEVENLRRLTRDDVDWNWTAVEEKEFLNIKTKVMNIQKQKYFNVNEPVTLECDASATGLGAALYQDDQVVGFASRTLTRTERNYAQIEKELLAILFGCTRFDQLLAGNRKITVKTDHKPLITIFQKPLLKAPKRLQLMLMVLQRYHLEVHFVKGKENVVADTLSRAPLDQEIQESREFERLDIFEIRDEKSLSTEIESIILDRTLQITPERVKEIHRATEADHTMQKLKEYITEGWPKFITDVEEACKIYFKYKDELSTQNGNIFRNGRILIPFDMRKNMVKRIHAAHTGIESSLKLARETVFWPGMSLQITQSIQACEICMKFMSAQQQPPMESHETPDYAFQYVSMDVFITEYKGKQTKFLVTVDHYSDYFELDILPDMTAETLINTCKRNFSRHGIPIRVCSDNGINFENKLMKDLAAKWGFEFVTSAPKHQRGNGKAESGVKIAKKLVKKAVLSGEDLWFMLLHWRNTPNKVGSSPNQRIFSRRTRSSIPMTTTHMQPEIVKNVSLKIESNKRRHKHYYDRTARILPGLEKGQSVAVQLNPDTDKYWSKGKILSKLKDREYCVEVNDRIYRRNIVHIKPFSNSSTEDNNSKRINSYNENEQTGINSSEFSNMDEHHRDNLNPESIKKESEESHKDFSDRPAPNIYSKEQEAPNGKKLIHQSTDSRPTRATKIPARFRDFVLN